MGSWRRLVEKGASMVVTDVFGNTALRKVADGGNLELVKWLIEQNVNVNIANNDGSIPAYIAAVCGHFHIVKCLMNQMDQTSTTEHVSAIAAEPELDLHTSYIETNDFFRRYAYRASKHERERYANRREFLRWVVEEKNLDVHQALWNGWGAVHLVAVGGNVEAMRWRSRMV
jgi:ankyrin repeat protein